MQYRNDINSHMQVPDRISGITGAKMSPGYKVHEDDPLEPKCKTDPNLAKMFIPETILMTEDNKFTKGICLTSFDDEDKTQFMSDLLNHSIELATPPNKLTLTDVEQIRKKNAFLIQTPVKEREMFIEADEEVLEDSLNHSLNVNNTLAEMSMVSTSDPEILTVVKKQIRFLNRRVGYLEKEIQNRQQREILFYAVSFIYLSIKSFMWFRKFL